jgi:hypothetical protein
VWFTEEAVGGMACTDHRRAGRSADLFGDRRRRRRASGSSPQPSPHFFSRDFNAIGLDAKSQQTGVGKAERTDRVTHGVAWRGEQQ